MVIWAAKSAVELESSAPDSRGPQPLCQCHRILSQRQAAGIRRRLHHQAVGSGHRTAQADPRGPWPLCQECYVLCRRQAAGICFHRLHRQAVGSGYWRAQPDLQISSHPHWATFFQWQSLSTYRQWDFMSLFWFHFSTFAVSNIATRYLSPRKLDR